MDALEIQELIEHEKGRLAAILDAIQRAEQDKTSLAKRSSDLQEQILVWEETGLQLPPGGCKEGCPFCSPFSSSVNYVGGCAQECEDCVTGCVSGMTGCPMGTAAMGTAAMGTAAGSAGISNLPSARRFSGESTVGGRKKIEKARRT